jgi:hypothetical protein
MSRAYSLGTYDPTSTPAKMVELMKHIPQMQHKHPEIPTSWTAKRREISEETMEKLLEASEKSNISVAMRYCRNCFSISRDLSIFWKEQPGHSESPKDYIYWEVDLRDLASAAEKRCSFCCFMACRLFDDTGIMKIWKTGIEQPKPPLGCCALAEEELPEVRRAIDRLRSFDKKYPDAFFGFIIQPIDYSLESLTFTKLRFLAATSNTGENGPDEILGFRRDLVLEIYRHPGMPNNILIVPTSITHAVRGSSSS